MTETGRKTVLSPYDGIDKHSTLHFSIKKQISEALNQDKMQKCYIFPK